ncbi:hypothetical protein ACSBR1_023205 [Camellia fascicularis]
MASSPHIVLFPFMSKGHNIPIIHLARFLLHRHATVTMFATVANRPFFSDSLADTGASIVDLPFPENINGLPAGVESTDKLPSVSLFVPFANATKLMQPDFEQALEILPNVTCLISDGFLGPESDDEPLTVPSFPWIKVTRNDFDEPFNVREPKGPHIDFVMEQAIATAKSYCIIMNSFYELESQFIDYWNNKCEPKARSIGPLYLAEPPRNKQHHHQKPTWLQWLDQKLAQGSSVLYVSFGSQVEISPKQLREIATGLEESKVSFLWVVRKGGSELADGFENRVKERGIVVREWVDQRAILGHECVKGFESLWLELSDGERMC